MTFRSLCTIIILCYFSLIDPAFSKELQNQLIMGWEPWEPYQYRNKNDKLTGLDIELITIISNAANCKVSFISKAKWHLLPNNQ